jgi:hypothetical protein
MDVGVVRVPDRARVNLSTDDGAQSCADLRITQVLGIGADEERFVLFDGRAELPVELALGPGLFEFALGSERPRRVSLSAGARLALRVR